MFLRAGVRVRKRTNFECAFPFPPPDSGSFGFWSFYSEFVLYLPLVLVVEVLSKYSTSYVFVLYLRQVYGQRVSAVASSMLWAKISANWDLAKHAAAAMVPIAPGPW